MTTEPTQPEVLAAVIGLTLHMRNVIKHTDRANPEQVATTLDALHEHLAIIGGSIITLADDLGHKEEVDARVTGNLAKAQAFAACGGIEGRA